MPYFVEKNKKDDRIKDKRDRKRERNDAKRSCKKNRRYTTISRMVNGVIMPSWDTLERIAKVLEVEPYELMSDAPRKDTEQHSVCPHCNKPISVVLQ